MNSSIKLIAYVKVYATFNTFVGLDPMFDKSSLHSRERSYMTIPCWVIMGVTFGPLAIPFLFLPTRRVV